MRDPRKNPVPGDVITRFVSTREVTATKQNDRGTVTHVVYGYPAVDLPETEATIASWRAWAKQDPIVVSEGLPPVTSATAIKDGTGKWLKQATL